MLAANQSNGLKPKAKQLPKYIFVLGFVGLYRANKMLHIYTPHFLTVYRYMSFIFTMQKPILIEWAYILIKLGTRGYG